MTKQKKAGFKVRKNRKWTVESSCPAIEDAINYFGGTRQMAKALSVCPQMIGKYRRACCRLTLERALQIENLTLGQVKIEDLILVNKAYDEKNKK